MAPVGIYYDMFCCHGTTGIYPAAMATSWPFHLLHILCNNPALGMLKICPNLQATPLPIYIETDSPCDCGIFLTLS